MRDRLIESLRRRGIDVKGRERHALSNSAEDAARVLAAFIDFAVEDVGDLYPGWQVPAPHLDELQLQAAQLPTGSEYLGGSPAIFLRRELYLVDDADKQQTHEATGLWLVLDDGVSYGAIRNTSIEGEARDGAAGWRQQIEASPIWPTITSTVVAVQVD